MAELHLPPTLPSLYTDLPRHVDVDAATVAEAIDRLEEPLARPARPAVRARARPSAATSTCTSTASGQGSTRPSSRARGST